MDPVILARIQFGLNICFHYIFPQISIGLGLFLVLTEGCYLWTKNPVYERITKFWVKIFALVFAIGVATGLVMVFAFGNNWSHFSRYVGDVFGSILGAEGIFAFFLESGFLGLLLFGWNRVSPKVHFFATCMVAFGAHFSGVWIVIANSWMQTPAGHEIVDAGGFTHAIIQNFWAVLTNPSSMDRLIHVMIGCWLSGAFFVISVSAYYALKKRHLDFARVSLKFGLIIGTTCVLLQLLSGDSTARGVSQNQPVKFASLEGVYKTQEYTGIYLFGVVNPRDKTVTGVQVPAMLSFLTYRNFKQAVPGLDQFSSDLWPNVSVVFQTYHGMIATWVLMFIGVVFGVIAWFRKKVLSSTWTLRYLVISVLFPQIGNQLGWCTAEIGRQPWVVQGLLKTQDAVSPNVSAEKILFSLVLYSFIYFLLFCLFIYLLNHKIQQGPDDGVDESEYRNQMLALQEF